MHSKYTIPLGRKKIPVVSAKNKSPVLLSHYHQPIQLLSDQMFCTCVTLLSHITLPRPAVSRLVSRVISRFISRAVFRVISRLVSRAVYRAVSRVISRVVSWASLGLSPGLSPGSSPGSSPGLSPGSTPRSSPGSGQWDEGGLCLCCLINLVFRVRECFKLAEETRYRAPLGSVRESSCDCTICF